MTEQLIEITSFDIEGRGVGHLENDDGSRGKVIFVEGALPGERVAYASYRKKAKWEAATVVAIHRESAQRVVPKCAYFGICGGCAMQHLDAAAQVAMKQRVLEDNLKHIGQVKAAMILRPIHGPTWGYRFRARISIRNVPKKGGVLVGFHERKSGYITDMRTCDVLPAQVSALLVPLRTLIAGLSITEQVPQIEVAIGEGAEAIVTALVLRIMTTLSPADEAALKAFADRHAVQWWLQTGGPQTATLFYPTHPELHYLLPEFALRIPFKPVDFTQVNHLINRILVLRAVKLLDAGPNDRVLDLFCGLGNFTLPLATLARQVVGIEGCPSLTQRARQNAAANSLSTNTSFHTANLFEMDASRLKALGKFDLMLIDPPRDGAMAVCQALIELDDSATAFKPRRIVYVSCNPATLARDASLLVHGAGYVLQKAGVINMFPHTAHVESIAVFELASSISAKKPASPAFDEPLSAPV